VEAEEELVEPTKKEEGETGKFSYPDSRCTISRRARWEEGAAP